MEIDHFLDSGTIISTEKEKILLGWGERVWLEQPKSSDIPFFYFPDYFLTYSHPWMTHAHWKEVSQEELLRELAISHKDAMTGLPKSDWETAEPRIFMEAFQDLQGRFQKGSLRKAVPFVFEFSKEPMSKPLLLRSIINALTYAQSNPVFLYGFWNQNEGILGTTPELLCSLNNQLVQTMAIAGTASGDRPEDEFLNDPKEKEEHQLVIQGIVDSLSPFGKIHIGETKIVRLPLISHLCTLLEVSTIEKISLREIVSALHPTPALGAFPRDMGWDWLQTYQKKIDRKRYGAPVGYLFGKTARCYVAIRNIQWDTQKIFIGAGCGVVKESRREKEWKEIQLKIQCVKNIFNF